ncbi:hypothetical protein AWB81_01233 [Caballeronia arationis]|uniref:Uncharacterized protein n=1 Tax=Caballeronia arationis TaxID=1777142 RepID=A0A7Z7N280_9BURK|nr:hypothetical protein AWB81_01233 [Caballeronia arationis]SOE60950.1 hypothetical protein SAMN05446927_2022 [Caballeronia arationis]
MYIGLLVSQNRHAQDYSPHHADMPPPDFTHVHRFAALLRAFKSLFQRRA